MLSHATYASYTSHASPWCDKCEGVASVRCSCDNDYCERCFQEHLRKRPRHRRGGTRESDSSLAWILGKIASLKDGASRATQFEKDEMAKWFGLHIDKTSIDRVSWVLETPRFTDLTEKSRSYYEKSPKRQYPSIISFVGETGAGKSTLSMPPSPSPLLLSPFLFEHGGTEESG